MEIHVGGGSGSQKSYDKPWTVVMKRGEESPGKEESSPSIIGGLGTGTSSGVKTVIKEGKSGFTPAQLQELEVQSLIQKHLAAGLPVPYHLVLPIWKSVATTFGTSQGGSIYKQYPSFIGFSTQGFDYRNMVDPEPGRCRRTDGKKWRCSRSIVPDQKYCAQHMHRGRQRSRKPVEASEASPSSANSLKRQLENSTSNLSNSVGLQLMTKSSNSTNVSHNNITTTSSYYGSKKRVSCITAPSITTSISSGTISATAATTNAATTIMAFMSNKSNQCIGSNDGGNHARNNCFIKGSSNNRNVNAGRNLSPGLGFSPKSVLREIPVVGCNNLSFDKRSGMELEPGRCRRTDGKKWRCSRNVVPDQKYCGRHMHRGAKKQVKNFQPTTIVANSSATSNTAQLPPTTAIPCRTVRAIPSTNLSISIPGSPPQIYNDEKSTSSSSSDTTITDTSINAYAISNVS